MGIFDRFRQWAEKPPESPLTIPAELHRAVMDLAPERNRAKMNQAARRSEAPPRSWLPGQATQLNARYL